MSKKITYNVGNKVFALDAQKAEAVQNAKRVINGQDVETFNLLPLKYKWAYDLYKQMAANHWEPEDIPMQRDAEQWRSTDGFITDTDRWIIKMGLGFFSAAEGMIGDNIMHGVRRAVTSPELKLVLGRHAHEENIHADSLLYMISSLGVDPYECQAMFEDIPSIAAKVSWFRGITKDLRERMGSDTIIDLTSTRDKQIFAKNLFVYGQAFEGMQFYSLFGMILSLKRQNKFPGIGQMFTYTLRDESNHIELLRKLFNELVSENPDIMTEQFKNSLVPIMEEAVALEDRFIDDCLPVSAIGLVADDYKEYIRYCADRRLEGIGLSPKFGAKNKLEWLSEAIDLKKEVNFFESRVVEYQKSSVLSGYDDDDL
tara:strand:- start:982 stop:2091 length:1110 start_codon:yes stop_codon:yes gene_type:complete